MRGSSPESWKSQVFAALVIVLAVGVVARVVWWALEPLIPVAVVGVVLIVVYRLILGRRR